MLTISNDKLDQLIHELKIRTGRRWTIREIAKETQVSPSYLTLLRNGQRKHPSMDVILKLSHFFQVSPEALVEEDGTASEGVPLPFAALPPATPTSESPAMRTLQLCQQLVEDNHPQQALDLLTLIESDLSSALQIQVLLLKASALTALKQMKQAEQLLNDLLQQPLSDADRATALYTRARLYHQKEMITSAISDMIQAAELASNAGVPDLLYKIHYSLGLCYKEKGEYGASIYHYEQSRRLFPEKYPPVAKAHLLMGLGNTYLRLQNLDTAMENYYLAEKIYRELHENKFVADIQHNISCVEITKGNYRQALDLLHQSLQAHQEADDHLGIGNDLLEMARAHKGLEEWEKASEFAQRANITFENGNRKGLAARAKSVLFEVFLQTNPQHEMIPALLDEILDVFAELHWDLDLARAYRLQADYYRLNGDTDKAIQTSVEALRLYESIAQSAYVGP